MYSITRTSSTLIRLSMTPGSPAPALDSATLLKATLLSLVPTTRPGASRYTGFFGSNNIARQREIWRALPLPWNQISRKPVWIFTNHQENDEEKLRCPCRFGDDHWMGPIL